MIAKPKLVAHYVATAVQAGTPAGIINSVLLDITEDTRVSEVFVTDADGNIEFGSHPGLNFKFPTDADSGTQTAPFGPLLEGTATEGRATAVVQETRPKELDGGMFQYLGVSSIARWRIVQVGIAGEP